MKSFVLSLSVFSLFLACKSGPPHSTPTSPAAAPPTSAAAVGDIHYFDLAPTQTPFDATKLQPVSYTLSSVQQGTQTGIHISIATPLDPNSDFFRLSVCADSNCSDPKRVQQEFAPAIWDYYPAPDLQGVLTIQVQACIDPARAKDPAVTCGPIQTKVWKQVANLDDDAAASMQTFQAERNGFQSDCEQARTLVNTYLKANPTPPSAPEALRFYNLAKNFSFMDPHACASLVRSGELWTIDAALQQNDTTPATSQGLGLADIRSGSQTQNILAVSAVASGGLSILCFVGAYQAWNNGSATISGEGQPAIVSNTPQVVAEPSPAALQLERLNSYRVKLETELKMTGAEIATQSAIPDKLDAIKIEDSELSRKAAEKRIREITNDYWTDTPTKAKLEATIEDLKTTANEKVTELKAAEGKLQASLTENTTRISTQSLAVEAEISRISAQPEKSTEIFKEPAPAEKIQTRSNKWAKASAGFGVVFLVAAVVLGVLSTQQLAADTSTTSQQALLDQFTTLRTQIDARMDRYLAAYVQ